MRCPECNEAMQDPGQGRTIVCTNETGMTLLWSHVGELCFVPDLREFLDGQGVQRRGFLTASFDDQCSWFHDGEPIRTRLDADLEYIDGLHSVENEEYVPLQRRPQGVLST